MSEDASAASDGTVTDTGDQGTADETTADDQEAAGLLDGMLENDPAALAAELARWKKNARTWETRSKANSAAAARLAEIENANKTELERAQDAQREAEAARDAALANHSRVMAAAAHNLPVELIDYLGTGTDEEINERAEAIATAIQAQAQAIAEQLVANAAAGRNGQPLGARPVESLRPGSQPASGAGPQTPDEWFRNLVQNR